MSPPFDGTSSYFLISGAIQFAGRFVVVAVAAGVAAGVA